LNGIESIIWRSGVQALMDKLEGACAAGQKTNLYMDFMYMTFDVMGEIIFGRSFNLVGKGDHPIIQWMSDFSRMSIFRVMFPILYRVQIPWLFGHLYESERKVYEFTQAALEQRKKEENPRRDALQQLIEAVDEETGETMRDPEIVPEMVVQM
jgi:cytochrome P450